MRFLTKAGAALFLVALLAGCVTTTLAPHKGSSLVLEEDEKRIWTMAEKGDKQLARSGLVENVPELESYLQQVMRKLYPELPFECRIHIVRNTGLNAFALPNGSIYVHTGMLARMENEAQLATVLGHEMTHVTHRHAVNRQRDLLRKTAIYSTITLGGWGGDLFALASLTGYSRDMEREADAEGYRRMAAAGYDPAEAAEFFRILKKWIEETGVSDPYFFSTHPKVKERIENYEALIAASPPVRKGIRNREIYLSKTRGILFQTTLLDLKSGRFESALQGADKFLSTGQEGADGRYLRGEVFRQRNGEGDGEKAAEEYRKAIALDNSYAESYRALGMILYKKSEKDEARKCFEKYLLLNPAAPDRAYIEGYLRAPL